MIDNLHSFSYGIYSMYVQGGADMSTAKVFKNGNSQAIRIPKEMQTKEKEFIIQKSGECYFLLPKNDPWALLRQCFSMECEDLSFERNQPSISDLEERECL